MQGTVHAAGQPAAKQILTRFVGPLRTAWRRGAWISANVSRDFSRRPLVNDGWPICR